MIDPTADLALCAQEWEKIRYFLGTGVIQMLRKEILIEIHTVRISV